MPKEKSYSMFHIFIAFVLGVIVGVGIMMVPGFGQEGSVARYDVRFVMEDESRALPAVEEEIDVRMEESVDVRELEKVLDDLERRSLPGTDDDSLGRNI